MHIAWEYPPLVYGGLGRHVHALAVAQAENGHDVTVITQQVDSEPRTDVMEGVTVVRRSPTPALDFVPDNLLSWVGELDASLAAAATAQVAKMAAAGTPVDVIHCHDWMTTQAGIEAAQAAGVPLVATIHATERGRHQGHLPGDVSVAVDATEQRLCQAADELITCSQAMREDVITQLGADPDRVVVLPNGIDETVWRTEDSQRRRARVRWGGTGPLLMFTGRLEVEKGIYTMLDALPTILNNFPDARLVVAGQGGQGGQFDADIAERGLSPAVIRAGWLSEEELKALIAAADVALVPSIYEPFGLVALEAMALGTPVVAARTGGLADIVDNGRTGLTFTPGDPGELASAVAETLSDPRAAAARADLARAELPKRFNWRHIAEDTVAVYEQATRA